VLIAKPRRRGKESKKKGAGKKRRNATGKKNDVGWKNRRDSGLSRSAGGNKTTKCERRKTLR
jgi:hypothetical protein